VSDERICSNTSSRKHTLKEYYCRVTKLKKQIIVFNVRASREDTSDDLKHSFYEELGPVFDLFPRYHMKILLGDINAIVDRADILKPTFGTRDHTKSVMIMES
jgi:hypothetical protein